MLEDGRSGRRGGGARTRPSSSRSCASPASSTPGRYGLVVILAGVVAGLRGEQVELARDPALRRRATSPGRTTRTPAIATAPTSSSPATGLDGRLVRRRCWRSSAIRSWSSATRRRSRSTSTPTSPRRRWRCSTAPGRSATLDIADMHEQVAERSRAARGRRGARRRRRRQRRGHAASSSRGSARSSSTAARRFNPPTKDLLAAIRGARRRGARAAELAQRDHGRRGGGASSAAKRRRVVACATPSRPGSRRWSSSIPPRSPSENAERLDAGARRGPGRRRRARRARRRRGPLPPGDSVGFAGDEVVAWGGAGRR